MSNRHGKYRSLSRTAELLQYCNWYSVPALVQCLNKLRGLNFTLEQDRRAMRGMLNLLILDSPPFGLYVRFPATGYYVCEGGGDIWLGYLTLLRKTLDCSESDDASKAEFWGITRAMLKALTTTTSSSSTTSRDTNEVYDRETFEKNFYLEWS